MSQFNVPIKKFIIPSYNSFEKILSQCIENISENNITFKKNSFLNCRYQAICQDYDKRFVAIPFVYVKTYLNNEGICENCGLKDFVLRVSMACGFNIVPKNISANNIASTMSEVAQYLYSNEKEKEEKYFRSKGKKGFAFILTTNDNVKNNDLTSVLTYSREEYNIKSYRID